MSEQKHPDDLSAEERARLEWETAPLVELVGEAAEARVDSADAARARFCDWVARDLRAREAPGRRLTDDQLARSRERVRARALARRLWVRLPRDPEPRALAGDAPNDGAPWYDLSVAAGVGRELWDMPCERRVELPPELGMPRATYVALSVAGDSMAPLFHSGDTILVRVGAEVRRGTVIVARHPEDGYVVKAVRGVGRREIVLGSLNPEYAPIAIPHDERLIVGTVVLRWCPHDARRPSDPPNAERVPGRRHLERWDA